MKRLTALLLTLALLGVCSVSLASNPNINGFISDTLDALSAFDLSKQALTLTVEDSYYGSPESIQLQQSNGLTRLEYHSRYASQSFTVEFNNSQIWLLNGNQCYTITFAQAEALASTALSMAGSELGLSDIIDAYSSDALGEAIGAYISLLIQYAASAVNDSAGNYILRLDFTQMSGLMALDQWIQEIENRPAWQDAILDLSKSVFSLMADVSDAGDLSFLGDLVTRSDLVEALEKLRDEQIKPAIEALQNPDQSSNDYAASFVLTLDGNGDFVSAVFSQGDYEELAIRYMEDGTTLEISSSGGYYKYRITSDSRNRLAITTHNNSTDSDELIGTITQSKNGSDWSLVIEPTDQSSRVTLSLAAPSGFTPLSKAYTVIDASSFLQYMLPQ